jgi:hypothetical protein
VTGAPPRPDAARSPDAGRSPNAGRARHREHVAHACGEATRVHVKRLYVQHGAATSGGVGAWARPGPRSALNSSTRVCGRVSRSRRASSRPSMPGMRTSVSNRSTAPACRWATPSASSRRPPRAPCSRGGRARGPPPCARRLVVHEQDHRAPSSAPCGSAAPAGRVGSAAVGARAPRRPGRRLARLGQEDGEARAAARRARHRDEPAALRHDAVHHAEARGRCPGPPAWW